MSFSLRSFEYAVSDMGDSSVLMGVVITAALYFFICRDHREGIAILLSLALAASTIALLKLIFLSCGHNYLDIKSPSGHSALSIAVYGTYPFLLAPRVGRKMRIVLFAVFFALAIGIAVTRVSLHMHSLNEAILGVIVGGAVILFIRHFVLGNKSLGFGGTPRFNIFILLVLTGVIIFSLHGMHFPAEKIIGQIARFIRGNLSFCR